VKLHLCFVQPIKYRTQCGNALAQCAEGKPLIVVIFGLA
jgi:hypothetical protein